MSFETASLLFLLKHTRQIDDAKRHLISAARELLLAAASSFDIVSSAAGETGLPERSPLAEAALKKIDFLLRFSLDLLPKPRDAASETLRRDVLGSIVSVLDEEIRSLEDSPEGSRPALQRQALIAVRAALIRRCDPASLHRSAPEPDKKAAIS